MKHAQAGDARQFVQARLAIVMTIDVGDDAFHAVVARGFVRRCLFHVRYLAASPGRPATRILLSHYLRLALIAWPELQAWERKRRWVNFARSSACFSLDFW
jgi:hypothetical protein